jgi:hypothetical protein
MKNIKAFLKNINSLPFNPRRLFDQAEFDIDDARKEERERCIKALRKVPADGDFGEGLAHAITVLEKLT